MEPVTYSLKVNEQESDVYYHEIKNFTDKILNKFGDYNTNLIEEFISYNSLKNAKIRRNDDYIFELLMMGTFLNVYGKRSNELNESIQTTLENLVEKRNQGGCKKESIDALRGVLMTKYMLPENEDKTEDDLLNFDAFDRLLKYLKAAGDFNQEVQRLMHWKDFLTTRSYDQVSQCLKIAIDYANYFERRGIEALGKYTKNVDEFLKTEHEKHLWMEDVLFCSRKEVEYHLNMVGAEIMNRSFEKEFTERNRRALLLPGCIRYTQKNCRAEETNLGLKCISCSKKCNVSQLTSMGDRYNFEVYIVTHESSAFKKSTEKDRDELAIIGVACVSNLIAGGWKSDALNIPAQCVLLEQSTCKSHWSSEGHSTDINTNQLKKLLEIPDEIQSEIPQKSEVGI